MENDFSKYHLSDGALIITDEVPGSRSRKLLDLQKDTEGSIVSYPVKMPLAIKRAKGAIIEDLDGNHFIDFFSCAGVVNVGHCNQEVLEYVKDQQDELIHALDFPTENKAELVHKLINHLPAQIREDYKVSFCGPTGSDAVEAAIKLAKHVTGRSGVIAFHGSYHGMTAGSLAVTSNTDFRERLNSIMPDVHYVPYSYCYRCPFNKQEDSCQLECANYLRNILENPHSGVAKPAAILLEPIQGEGGSVVPKDGYLEEIVSIAREHEVIVIFDEIQSGFFRSGEFFASQHGTAIPDIYTLSKGLGGVGLPISAIMYDRRIESWGPGFHVGTFRGNQMSIAAGNGAFDFVHRHEVDQNAVVMGEYLVKGLRSLAKHCDYIGDVRGRGLMIGIEFVKNRETKEPFVDFAKKLQSICCKNGLLFELGGHYSNVIRFLPPLTITKAIADNALEIFEEGIKTLIRVDRPENEYSTIFN